MTSQVTILVFLFLLAFVQTINAAEPKDEHAANCYQYKDSQDIYCTGCTGAKCNTCLCLKGKCDVDVVCNTCEGKICRTCKISGKTQECEKCNEKTTKFWVVNEGKVDAATSCPQ